MSRVLGHHAVLLSRTQQHGVSAMVLTVLSLDLDRLPAGRLPSFDSRVNGWARARVSCARHQRSRRLFASRNGAGGRYSTAAALKAAQTGWLRDHNSPVPWLTAIAGLGISA